ncbi:MAG: hypothetical protein ABJE47_14865, partial [bacterium]
MARSTRGESAWTQTSAWFAPLVVVVVTVIAFLPTLRAGFVSWDDDKNFLANPHYRGLGLEQLGWMWSTFQLGHYVPLSWMSLGADYLVWGMDPAGYHATNLLLHAANSALVYFLARRVLLAARVGTESNSRDVVIASAISALAFSVHPLRVESVAWITERRDVLSLFFYLSSALLYLRSIEDNAHRDRWYWLSLAAFACALLSKATAVTLPAILVAFNCFPLRRLGGSEHGWLDHSARNVYRELFPFVLLSAATVTVTFVALQHLPQLDVMRKVAVSMYGIAFYTWKSVAPSKLAPLYAMPARVDPFAVRYVVSCIIVVTVSIAAWFVRRRWPMATLGWVTFLLGVFPMLGFVQNGPQLVADRYSYFAAPFLGLAVAAALLELNRR